MSVDLSEFAEPEQRGNCKVRTVLAELDAGQAEKLRAALATDSVTTTKISRVVTGWGHPVGKSSISRHRLGECSCD